jgi:hypothetical protein
VVALLCNTASFFPFSTAIRIVLMLTEMCCMLVVLCVMTWMFVHDIDRNGVAPVNIEAGNGGI